MEDFKYERPIVEVILVEVEKGFAESLAGDIPGYGDGGIL